jgi:transcription elongation factor Elf1
MDSADNEESRSHAEVSMKDITSHRDVECPRCGDAAVSFEICWSKNDGAVTGNAERFGRCGHCEAYHFTDEEEQQMEDAAWAALQEEA